MAVYQDTRSRPGFLPRLVDVPALPRRRARRATRAGRGSSRVGILLGAIALAFLLAFFSLAQSVRVSATGYDIDRLLNDQAHYQSQVQQLLTDLNRLGRGPAIVWHTPRSG